MELGTSPRRQINGYLVVKMVDRNEVIPLPKSNIAPEN